MVQLPASGAYLRAVRESARKIRETQHIQVNEDAIRALLLSPAFTTTFPRLSKNHGLALPLRFSSPLAELNFLAVISLLNFASGYRAALHVETGRGAWDNIRALAFAMHIESAGDEGDLLSAAGMRSIGDGKVAELMRVNVHVERAHEQIPGVTVGELGGPMYELVRLVTKTLNETGAKLEEMGYPDLGTLVAEALRAGRKARLPDKPDADADKVLEQIVRAIPAFQDMYEVDGEPVYCFKKALFLIHAIFVRFGSLEPPPFPAPETSGLPVFSDNVIPSMLVYLGVVDLSASPLQRIFSEAQPNDDPHLKLAGLLALPLEIKKEQPRTDQPPTESSKEGPVVSAREGYILRAAAIDACETAVRVAHGMDVPADLEWIRALTLPDLDAWLWAGAKDRSDYRQLSRFMERGTVFF
ncbi:hypothetical protein BD626DRAFT_475180 [Schizophyllum amplum]|uniref:Queuosine 5'-phosphate N-glycosylase/hydrolase n=1 Tax=Schizophyllum amplum TaxID=97359 RepID=A0A550CY82_9AGAR|nr:hypothetical protein BD626DRAFT_475180 [Auriculariopsis ampla]